MPNSRVRGYSIRAEEKLCFELGCTDLLLLGALTPAIRSGMAGRHRLCHAVQFEVM